jgi:hypothetical protein
MINNTFFIALFFLAAGCGHMNSENSSVDAACAKGCMLKYRYKTSVSDIGCKKSANACTKAAAASNGTIEQSANHYYYCK